MPTSTAALSIPASRSRGRRVTLYILLGLISLLFLFAAGQKLLGTEQMTANMARLQYSVWAMRVIGLIEVAAVAALWWRLTRTLSLRFCC